MAETPTTVEVRLLRQDFKRHEEQDENRHVGMTRELVDIKVAQADLKGFIRGRATALAVLMAVLAVVIPLLTVIVSAWFGHPQGAQSLSH